MKLKYLYILVLSLCLGSVANSNECTRHCPGTAARSTQPATGRASEAGSSAAGSSKADGGPTESARSTEESSDFTQLPLIRLLYI